MGRRDRHREPDHVAASTRLAFVHEDRWKRGGCGADLVKVARGQIWLVNLDPTVGSEIKKSRPCVVVSPPEMHDYLRTLMVAPMTTKGRPAPFRVPVTHAGKSGVILLDQVRAIDKARLVRKSGALSAKTLAAVLATLQAVFAE